MRKCDVCKQELGNNYIELYAQPNSTNYKIVCLQDDFTCVLAASAAGGFYGKDQENGASNI